MAGYPRMEVSFRFHRDGVCMDLKWMLLWFGLQLSGDPVGALMMEPDGIKHLGLDVHLMKTPYFHVCGWKCLVI
jgi:hypothetical protein